MNSVLWLLYIAILWYKKTTSLPKFRVRYQGQKITCGYCAEYDHVERDCQKKANLRVLAKTSRLRKRMAKLPTEADNLPTQRKPTPNQDEAAKSFERATTEERTNNSSVAAQLVRAPS